MKNKNQLIGCCGLDCENCDARIATITDDNALREQTATLWSKLNGVTITPEMINCVGCRIEGVKTPFCDKLCPIHNCVRKNGLDTCADCSQMEGLRQELIPFAEKYVENTYYSFNENEFVAFEQRGKGTIDLALERPYLFRFLYTGERSQLLSNGFCHDDDGIYTGNGNLDCFGNRSGYKRKYVLYASQYGDDIFKRLGCRGGYFTSFIGR